MKYAYIILLGGCLLICSPFIIAAPAYLKSLSQETPHYMDSDRLNQLPAASSISIQCITADLKDGQLINLTFSAKNTGNECPQTAKIQLTPANLSQTNQIMTAKERGGLTVFATLNHQTIVTQKITVYCTFVY